MKPDSAWIYLHPSVAALTVLLCLWATNTGLSMRRLRVKCRDRTERLKRRHAIIAKPAALLLLTTFIGGTFSARLLRGWPPLQTLHGASALVATTLLLVASGLGIALKLDRSERAALHGVLAMLGILAGLLAAVSGIEWLP